MEQGRIARILGELSHEFNFTQLLSLSDEKEDNVCRCNRATEASEEGA